MSDRPQLLTSNTVSGIDLTAVTGIPLIPRGNAGIIDRISIQVLNAKGGAAAGSYVLFVVDGTGDVILGSGIGLDAAQASGPTSLFNGSGLNVAFTDGLVLTRALTGTAFASGAAVINIWWRQARVGV
jgi:hypothetical protein